MGVKGILQTQQGTPVADAIIAVTGATQPVNDMASVSGADGSFGLSGVPYPAEVALQISYNDQTYNRTASIDEEGNLLVRI